MLDTRYRFSSFTTPMHWFAMGGSELFVLILFTIIHNGIAANILGLMGCPSRSHHIWNEVLINALAERGHTLTVVSVESIKEHHDNIKYIHLEETYNTIEEHMKAIGLPAGPISSLFAFSKFQIVTCKGVLKSKGFQEALALEDSFDLILYDILPGPCLLKLVTKFPQIPVVALSAYKVTAELLHIAGGHSYPAYIPFISNELELPMNYWERLYNSGIYAIYEYYRKYVTEVIINTMVSKQFPSDKTSTEDLYRRINIFLVNSHPVLDLAQSLPPNIIEVGGLAVKEPKPLPPDIDKFMNSSESGVVFISLGTNIRIDMMGEKNLEHFLNVIGRFSDYNFLWKVDQPQLIKNPPKNLLIRKWFSQNDILNHPKLKVFFTHGGGLSTHETIWYGVPVVVMPFFLDQHRNARFFKAHKLGTMVDLDTLTEEQLYQSLSAVLTSDVYRDNMKAMQRKFRDRPHKPLDTAVWWVEHALRTPDLGHIVPDARYMSYFVADSVDVLLTVFVIIVLFLINLWVIMRNIKVFVSKEKKFSKPARKASKTQKIKRS